MATADQPTYSVCIATFRRPLLLAHALESVSAQHMPPGATLEIVVVDNDAARSAAETVARFRQNAPVAVQYAVEPEQNISLARNRSVALSRGQFLLFLDDDETAGPTWIAELAAAQQAYAADIVTGQMIPAFADDVPPRMRRREYFYHPVLPTGSRPRFLSCGNCLVRRSAVTRISSPPFDPAYGLTGGEDTHFLKRLIRAGSVTVTCAEAQVFEAVPRQRATLGYLFRKSVKNGNCFARREIEFAAPHRGRKRLRIAGRALIHLGGCATGLFTLGLYWPQRVEWSKRLGANIGKLMAACGGHYRAYAQSHAACPATRESCRREHPDATIQPDTPVT